MGDTKMFLFFSNVSTINAVVSEIVFYGILTGVDLCISWKKEKSENSWFSTPERKKEKSENSWFSTPERKKEKSENSWFSTPERKKEKSENSWFSTPEKR